MTELNWPATFCFDSHFHSHLAHCRIFTNVYNSATLPLTSQSKRNRLVVDGSICTQSGKSTCLLSWCECICQRGNFACLHQVLLFAEWRQSLRTRLISRWCAEQSERESLGPQDGQLVDGLPRTNCPCGQLVSARCGFVPLSFTLRATVKADKKVMTTVNVLCFVALVKHSLKPKSQLTADKPFAGRGK